MLLGENIREARRKSGLSQEEMAGEIGVSRQTISNWEKGINSPPTASLEKISQRLGISVQELLGERPPAQPAPPPAQPAPPSAQPAPPSAQPPAEPPLVKKTFRAVCALCAALVIALIAVTLALRSVSARLDRLEQEKNTVYMGDMVGEEVDASTFGHSEFERP